MKILKTANSVNPVEKTEEIEERGIMIVDDSKFSRNILKDILQNEGFQVVAEAKNGLEAVEMTKQKKPQFIFMDVEMPILDGLGAIPKILEVDPKVHIIMCTAMGQKNIIVEAARAGAKDYVLKPYRKENIIRVLSTIIEPKQKDGQVIPFKNGKKNKEDTQNQSSSYGEEKLQEDLANKVRQVISQEAFMKSIQSEDVKKPEDHLEDTRTEDKQEPELTDALEQFKDDFVVDNQVEETIEESISDSQEESFEETNSNNPEDTLNEAINENSEDTLEEAISDSPENTLEEAISDKLEDSLETAGSDNLENFLETAGSDKLEDLSENSELPLNQEEIPEPLDLTGDSLEDRLELAYEQALDEKLLDHSKEAIDALEQLPLQDNRMTRREENLPPLDLSANSNSSQGSSLELKPVQEEGRLHIDEKKDTTEDSKAKDETEEDKSSLELDEQGELEANTNSLPELEQVLQAEPSDEDTRELSEEPVHNDEVNEEKANKAKEEKANEADEEIANEVKEEIANEADEEKANEAEEEITNEANEEITNEGTVKETNEEKASNGDAPFVSELQEEEKEAFNEETPAFLSYSPADRIDYTFLWSNRFELRQQEEVQPATIRLSLYNAAHLASDGFGMEDWNPSNKKIMLGMINAYLNLGNRLNNEEELLLSRDEQGQEATRILSDKILVEERMERVDLTMSDFLNQSDEEPHTNIIVSNSTLSNMMQQLIHSKAERVLMNEGMNY